MMSEGGNAGSKWCGKKLEEVVRTVDCLRGRLLAERLASRKNEEEQLGNKLMELENLLKQEAKSRNMAEKRLKSLFKKLDSMNISYVSDESGYSGLEDKSDISSLSKSEQGSENNLHKHDDSQNNFLIFSDDNGSAMEGSSSTGFEAVWPDFKGQEYTEMGQNENNQRSPEELSENFEQKNIGQNSIIENFLFSEDDANSEKSRDLGSDQNYNDSKMDEQRDICYHRFRFSTNEEDDQDDMRRVDNSMAVVAVDMPRENRTVDPEVLDHTVMEVLDALRRAKEQIRSSIEQKRVRVNMVRVGRTNSLDNRKH